jgi:hypothetical protein
MKKRECDGKISKRWDGQFTEEETQINDQKIGKDDQLSTQDKMS